MKVESQSRGVDEEQLAGHAYFEFGLTLDQIVGRACQPVERLLDLIVLDGIELEASQRCVHGNEKDASALA